MDISEDGLNVCWNDIELSDDLQNNILDCIQTLEDNNYSVGFMLYDINTGYGISYCPDVYYYSASAVKAPYVTSVIENNSSVLDDYYSTIYNIIKYSDNECYKELWETFGTDDYVSWMSEIDCDCIDTSEKYTEFTAKQLSKMWTKIYSYFSDDTDTANKYSELFINTTNSCINKALSSDYTVYSKAGWISSRNYYVQNDGGIVMYGDSPYVVTVLSNAYNEITMLENLINSLNTAHQYLLAN